MQTCTDNIYYDTFHTCDAQVHKHTTMTLTLVIHMSEQKHLCEQYYIGLKGDDKPIPQPKSKR